MSLILCLASETQGLKSQSHLSDSDGLGFSLGFIRKNWSHHSVMYAVKFFETSFYLADSFSAVTLPDLWFLIVF